MIRKLQMAETIKFSPLVMPEKNFSKSVLKLIVTAQVERFHSTYQIYFKKNNTRAIVEFFFDKIYSLDEESKKLRNLAAGKTISIVRKGLWESAKKKLDLLVYLIDYTDYMDYKMANLLQENLEAKKFLLASKEIDFSKIQKLSQQEYENLYQCCGNKEERIKQLELTLWNFEFFFQLSRKPLVQLFYKPIKALTKIIKTASLFQLFEQAYSASSGISQTEFFEFTKFVHEEELKFINTLLSNKNRKRAKL